MASYWRGTLPNVAATAARLRVEAAHDDPIAGTPHSKVAEELRLRLANAWGDAPFHHDRVAAALGI